MILNVNHIEWIMGNKLIDPLVCIIAAGQARISKVLKQNHPGTLPYPYIIKSKAFVLNYT